MGGGWGGIFIRRSQYPIISHAKGDNIQKLALKATIQMMNFKVPNINLTLQNLRMQKKLSIDHAYANAIMEIYFFS